MLGDRRDRIRHDKPVLLWEQVANDLRRSITSGELPPGARLPGYEDIATAYGVSGLTIRRALRELRGERLVVVLVGRGTYVAERT